MIKVKNLFLKIGDKEVIKDLNLNIKKSEKIILNSDSGAGKTSFLRVLQGFLPVEKGEITIGGLILNRKNISDIRGKIGYVSQKVELPQGKVKDILNMIFTYRKNKNINISRLKDFLKEFHLEESILEKDTKSISGGERQRLGFIICICLDRDIWLLDEVTASLDYHMKIKVEEYILKSNKTIILVSHDSHWSFEKFREVKW